MKLLQPRLTAPTMLAHTRRGVISQFAVLLASGGLSSSAVGASELSLPALAEGRRRLYLVRHGETDWNLEDRIQGRTDNPLNDAGRAQAAALARYLAAAPIELVASSTLQRAAVTADAVAAYHKSAPRVKDERFVEMGFGDLEGLKLPDIKARYKATTEAWAAGATGTAWPNGESCDDVGERGLAGLRELGLLGDGPASKTCPRHVLLAAHGRFNKVPPPPYTSSASLHLRRLPTPPPPPYTSASSAVTSASFTAAAASTSAAAPSADSDRVAPRCAGCARTAAPRPPACSSNRAVLSPAPAHPPDHARARAHGRRAEAVLRDPAGKHVHQCA